MEFQQAIQDVENYDEEDKEEFYQLFPEVVEQEKAYEIMAVQQHATDEGFAKDLEGKDFDEIRIDKGTQRSLKSQLSRLSATAGGEAASLQNVTVYNDVMEIWERSETPKDLLTYLENYADLRSERNERESFDPGKKPLEEPRAEYGDEDQEYIEEILTQLVEETIDEV